MGASTTAGSPAPARGHRNLTGFEVAMTPPEPPPVALDDLEPHIGPHIPHRVTDDEHATTLTYPRRQTTITPPVHDHDVHAVDKGSNNIGPSLTRRPRDERHPLEINPTLGRGYDPNPRHPHKRHPRPGNARLSHQRQHQR